MIGFKLTPGRREHTKVNIYSHSMVDLSPLREMLSYQPLVIHDAKADKELPLKWEQAHPVVGTQLLCLHFEPCSDTLVNLVITGVGACAKQHLMQDAQLLFPNLPYLPGNTWIFREDLEKNGFGA